MTKVDPERATTAMAELWQSYGNALNPALLEAWHQMAIVLNEAGSGKAKDKWTAMAMPTGTGKTQFAALYCALLPNPVQDISNILSGNLHPGVLFVTRFRDAAEALLFGSGLFCSNLQTLKKIFTNISVAFGPGKQTGVRHQVLVAGFCAQSLRMIYSYQFV
jgi:hypothetical protein